MCCCGELVGLLHSLLKQSYSGCISRGVQIWFSVTVFWVFGLVIASLVLTSCTENVESSVLSLTKVVTDEADDKVQQKITEYQDRVASNPSDADAVGNLGVIFELHGFSEEALLAYEIATSLQPDEFRWPYYHSILLAARFDLKHAIERITNAIEKNPSYAPARFQMGKLLLDSSQFKEALECFEYAAEITGDPYAYLGQAHAYMGLNKPESALASIDRTGPLTRHVNVQRLRATALIRTGNREEGARLLQGLPNAPPIRWSDPIAEEKNEHAVDHLIVQLSEAARLIRSKSTGTALQLLSELRNEYPTNKHVLHLLSSVYEIQGESNRALEILEEGMLHHPNFYVLRTAAASILASSGERERAFAQLDRAIEIDAKLHWAYSQKAQLLMQEKRWLEASHLLDRAIGLKDDDPDLYTYLGICLGFLDRWPEAANLFRVAVSIDPRHVPAYINLARAETFLQNEEGALAALASARQHGASEEMVASVERQRAHIKLINIQTANQ